MSQLPTDQKQVVGMIAVFSIGSEAFLQLRKFPRKRMGKSMSFRVPSWIGCEASMKEVKPFDYFDVEYTFEQ